MPFRYLSFAGVATVATLCASPVASAQAPVSLSISGTPLHAADAPDATPVATAADAVTATAQWVSGRVPARDARLFGHSGALRAIVVPSAAEVPRPLLEIVGGAEGQAVRWEALTPRGGGGLLGEPVAASAAAPDGVGLLGEPVAGAGLLAPSEPGIWRLSGAGDNAHGSPPLAVITPVPFERKVGGVLNGYRIGRYLTEGAGRTDIYAPPAAFIEVTRENQNFHVSENFQLRQFLTKNQADVWPKYVVLDMRLIDKLELVLQELNAMGIRADRMHVMSGFRTPEYNGPGRGGRAGLSRHTYGDAADVWVDSDGNGYMDDLNGDGVVDIRDAQLMLRAVDRVEQRYPELIGGAGLYVATGAHGPYIHIDVRGTPSRW
jgi:hypothetical protein